MKQPRILLAGTSSGSGKTTAVCALLALLMRRNKAVRSFKCGPDYIDPMFHRSVLGTESSNLDPFFCNDDLLRYLIVSGSGGKTAVVEGVMGYYDGTGESGSENSTYTVAKATKTPVILVVNAKGASSSLVAATEGFLNYMPESMIKGVIFNRITPMNYKYVCSVMEKRFNGAVIPLGYIPELPGDCLFPSRHLGLITADEIDDIKTRLEKIADICSDTLDINAILSVAEGAADINCTYPSIPSHKKVNIAVAYDSAFCFYYGDTVSLLKKMGAEIQYFSPLKNEPVPLESHGLLLGGGYPELYSDRLEANTATKNSVYKSVLSGMPTIAECGGFQYLSKSIDGRKMCGVIDSDCYKTEKLVRFGYITLTANNDCLFGKKGVLLRGHEFHYWDSISCGDSFTAVKPNKKTWKCVFSGETLYAGYPHLYLMSDINAAENFYLKCLEYKEKEK